MVPKLSSLQDVESEGEEDEWVKEIRTSHERQLTANEDIKQCMAQNRETLSRAQDVQDKIALTLEGINNTQERWNAFEETYAAMIGRLRQFDPMHEDIPTEALQNEFGIPGEMSASEAAGYLSSFTNICILTGEEMSTATSIDLQDMSWMVDDSALQHRQMQAVSVLESSPIEFWQAQVFLKSIADSIPSSACHEAVRRLSYHQRNRN